MNIDIIRFFEKVEALALYPVSPFVKALVNNDVHYRNQELDKAYLVNVLEANTYLNEQSITASAANSIADLLKEKERFPLEVLLTPVSDIFTAGESIFMQNVHGNNVSQFIIVVEIKKGEGSTLVPSVLVPETVTSEATKKAALKYFNEEMRLKIRRYIRASGEYARIDRATTVATTSEKE